MASVSAAYMVYKRAAPIVVSSGRTYSTKERRSGIVSVDKQNGEQGKQGWQVLCGAGCTLTEGVELGY